jgi:hypothetical protein
MKNGIFSNLLLKITNLHLKRKKFTLDEYTVKFESQINEFLSNIKSTRNDFDKERAIIDFLNQHHVLFQNNTINERYEDWIYNPKTNSELIDFAKYLHCLIKGRLFENKIEERKNRANKIIAQYDKQFIDLFNIAHHKLKELDEYGLNNPKSFEIEFTKFIKKLALHEKVLEIELNNFQRSSHSQNRPDFIFDEDLLLEAYMPTIKSIFVEIKPAFLRHCKGTGSI